MLSHARCNSLSDRMLGIGAENPARTFGAVKRLGEEPMRPLSTTLRWALARTCHAMLSAWQSLASFFRQPSGRRRVTIVAAAILVLSYALGVLAYVLFTPEIGVRCA